MLPASGGGYNFRIGNHRSRRQIRGIIPLTKHRPDIEPGPRDRPELVDQIEAMIARWEDGEGGTYRELAERIIALVIESRRD